MRKTPMTKDELKRFYGNRDMTSSDASLATDLANSRVEQSAEICNRLNAAYDEITKLRADLAAADERYAAERRAYAEMVTRVIEATGVEVPAGGMTAIEAVAAARRERDDLALEFDRANDKEQWLRQVALETMVKLLDAAGMKPLPDNPLVLDWGRLEDVVRKLRADLAATRELLAERKADLEYEYAERVKAEVAVEELRLQVECLEGEPILDDDEEDDNPDEVYTMPTPPSKRMIAVPEGGGFRCRLGHWHPMDGLNCPEEVLVE